MRYLLDEITDDGVVHVGDLVPLEPFQDVLFLLLLEYHFGDELVQLLVAVVCRQLFETVARHVLKAVHVQNGQYFTFPVLPYLNDSSLIVCLFVCWLVCWLACLLVG